MKSSSKIYNLEAKKKQIKNSLKDYFRLRLDLITDFIINNKVYLVHNFTTSKCKYRRFSCRCHISLNYSFTLSK